MYIINYLTKTWVGRFVLSAILVASGQLVQSRLNYCSGLALEYLGLAILVLQVAYMSYHAIRNSLKGNK